MCGERPDFLDSPFFYVDDNGWHLKEGAPKETVEEFERYMSIDKMSQHKEKYTIDFTNVNNFLEMHFVIKEALDFPDYYGCNWSALWDSLTDMYGEPIHIEILGLENIKNKFGEETVDKMIEIFKRFKHFEKSFENDIEIEIALGKTKTTIA